MFGKQFYLQLFKIFIVMFSFVKCDNLFQKVPEKTKIVVHPNPNTIWISQVKPTSAVVEHEPGIPPGWPKPPKVTTTRKPFNKPYKPLNLFGVAISRPISRLSSEIRVTENVVESKPLVVRDSSNTTFVQYPDAANPHRGNVIDWFLGVVGIRPPSPNPPTVKPVKGCPSCTCGRTVKRKRIVGGIETMVNEYPWMTALMYNDRFYCGASLISNKYILSAAHCVSGFSRERLSAVFLDHDRSTSHETQTFMRKIKNIYRHSSYGSGGNYNNDIALLQLDQEVDITGTLKPVCLPPTGKSFTNFNGIAIGWGATKEHGQISNKLQEVTVPIMSNIECRKTGYGYKITDNMLCAGYPDGKKDSCQGDSGGPLQVVNGTVHQIVGVVSWGEGCAQPNFPGVYTRVNRYISWIRSNTRDACYCQHSLL